MHFCAAQRSRSAANWTETGPSHHAAKTFGVSQALIATPNRHSISITEAIRVNGRVRR
jgi:hypothetical protein